MTKINDNFWHKHNVQKLKEMIPKLDKADSVAPDQEEDNSLIWDYLYELEEAVQTIGKIILDYEKERKSD